MFDKSEMDPFLIHNNMNIQVKKINKTKPYIFNLHITTKLTIHCILCPQPLARFRYDLTTWHYVGLYANYQSCKYLYQN